jgi:hypothetical protein
MFVDSAQDPKSPEPFMPWCWLLADVRRWHRRPSGLLLCVAALLVAAQVPSMSRVLARSVSELEGDEESKEGKEGKEGKASDPLVVARGHHRGRLRKPSAPPACWLTAAFGSHVVPAALSCSLRPISAPPCGDLAGRNGLGAPLRC